MATVLRVSIYKQSINYPLTGNNHLTVYFFVNKSTPEGREGVTGGVEMDGFIVDYCTGLFAALTAPLQLGHMSTGSHPTPYIPYLRGM